MSTFSEGLVSGGLLEFLDFVSVGSASGYISSGFRGELFGGFSCGGYGLGGSSVCYVSEPGLSWERFLELLGDSSGGSDYLGNRSLIFIGDHVVDFRGSGLGWLEMVDGLHLGCIGGCLSLVGIGIRVKGCERVVLSNVRLLVLDGDDNPTSFQNRKGISCVDSDRLFLDSVSVFGHCDEGISFLRCHDLLLHDVMIGPCIFIEDLGGGSSSPSRSGLNMVDSSGCFGSGLLISSVQQRQPKLRNCLRVFLDGLRISSRRPPWVTNFGVGLMDSCESCVVFAVDYSDFLYDSGVSSGDYVSYEILTESCINSRGLSGNFSVPSEFSAEFSSRVSEFLSNPDCGSGLLLFGDSYPVGIRSSDLSMFRGNYHYRTGEDYLLNLPDVFRSSYLGVLG